MIRQTTPETCYWPVTWSSNTLLRICRYIIAKHSNINYVPYWFWFDDAEEIPFIILLPLRIEWVIYKHKLKRNL